MSEFDFDVYLLCDIEDRKVSGRISRINYALQSKALITWISSASNASGNDIVISTRIRRSQAVLVFVTKQLEGNISNPLVKDSTKIEFAFITQNVHENCLIPVIMEKYMLKKPWTGPLGITLNTKEYIDFSDDTAFQSNIDVLYNTILSVVKKPLLSIGNAESTYSLNTVITSTFNSIAFHTPERKSGVSKSANLQSPFPSPISKTNKSFESSISQINFEDSASTHHACAKNTNGESNKQSPNSIFDSRDGDDLTKYMISTEVTFEDTACTIIGALAVGTDMMLIENAFDMVPNMKRDSRSGGVVDAQFLRNIIDLFRKSIYSDRLCLKGLIAFYRLLSKYSRSSKSNWIRSSTNSTSTSTSNSVSSSLQSSPLSTPLGSPARVLQIQKDRKTNSFQVTTLSSHHISLLHNHTNRNYSNNVDDKQQEQQQQVGAGNSPDFLRALASDCSLSQSLSLDVHNLSTCEGNISHFVDLGGVELLLMGLQLHLTRLQICEIGMVLLRICVSSHRSSHPSRRSSQPNVLPVLLKVMKTHCASSPLVCQLGLLIVSYYCSSHDASVDLSSHVVGFIEIIQSVMKMQVIEEPIMAEIVCLVIRNICSLSNLYRAKLGKFGICESIIKLLGVHMNSEQLVLMLLQLVPILCEDNNFNKDQMVQAHACETVTQILRAFSQPLEAEEVKESFYIATAALKAVYSLCYDSRVVTRFLAAGVFDILATTLSPSSPPNHLTRASVLDPIIAASPAISSLVSLQQSARSSKTSRSRVSKSLESSAMVEGRSLFRPSVTSESPSQYSSFGTQSTSISSSSAPLAPKTDTIIESAMNVLLRFISVEEAEVRKYLVDHGIQTFLIRLHDDTKLSDSIRKDINENTSKFISVEFLHHALDDIDSDITNIDKIDIILKSLLLYKKSIQDCYNGKNDNDSCEKSERSTADKNDDAMIRQMHQALGLDTVIIPTIVKLLKYNRHNVQICIGCFKAIAFLCRYSEDKTTSCDINVNKLGEYDACNTVVTITYTHRKIGEVAILGCTCIRNLSADSHTNACMLGDAGACGLIIRLFNHHISNSDVISLGCGALSNLARISENEHHIQEAEACAMIIKVLHEYKNDYKTVEKVCACLVNFAADSSYESLLDSLGICPLLIELLEHHQQWHSCIEQILWCISNVADLFGKRLEVSLVAENTADGIKNSDGSTDRHPKDLIALMLRLLQQYIQNVNIVEVSCWAMKNLVSSNEGYKKYVRELSGDDLLACVAMGRPNPYMNTRREYFRPMNHVLNIDSTYVFDGAEHRNGDSDVTEMCASNGSFSVGRNLLCSGEVITAETKSKALETFRLVFDVPDLVELINNAHISIESCTDTSEGTYLGYKALQSTYLLIHQNPDMKRSLSNYSPSIEKIIEIIRTYFKIDEFVTVGVAVVRHMSQNNKIQNAANKEMIKILGDSGVCKLMTSIMRAYEHCDSVLEESIWVVGNLSYRNSNNCQKFYKFGVCDIIISLLRYANKMLQLSLLEALCWAVQNLCDQKDNLIKLGRLGICEIIMTSMQLQLDMNQSDPKILVCILRALVCLSIGGGNDVRLGISGACEALVTVMRRHIDEPTVVEAACWAANNMCSSDSGSKNDCKFGDAGACEVIVNILDRHSAHPKIVEAALSALSNISAAPSNETKLAKTNIDTVIIYCLHIHKYHQPRIVETGFCALNNVIEIFHKNISNHSIRHSCETIFTALKLQSSDPAVVSEAFGVINHLAERHQYEICLIDLLATEGIIDALRLHTTSPEIVENGCLVLYTLVSSHDEHKKRAVLAHGTDLLRELQNDSKLSASARLQALETLRVLVAK